MVKTCVIGDGGWGTALALLLHSAGVDTVLWSAFPEYAEYLRKKRDNTKFLKGIRLPEDLKITAEKGAVESSEFAFFAVPCKHLRSVAETFKGAEFSCIISATKGIESETL
ncbi:MAG: NAD(P)-binding domain-containing protein, partial [Candidatus Omnitrophota bacterium]